MTKIEPHDGTETPASVATTQRDRALHVLVPEEAIIQAHRAALESKPRLRFRHYITQLLLAAKPIKAVPIDELTGGSSPVSAQ